MRRYCLVASVCLCLAASVAAAADYETANFVVTAGSIEDAREVAAAAEEARALLAQRWLGRELPRWPQPCCITVRTDTAKMSGYTSFVFEGRSVHSWTMQVQGPFYSILDTVVPHEVLHTVLVSERCRALSRCLDEGIAATAERRQHQETMHRRCVNSVHDEHWIPLRELLDMWEYPQANMLQLYYEGATLVSFLLYLGECEAKAHGHPDPRSFARRKILELERTAYDEQSWDIAMRCYGFSSVEDMERSWHRWLGTSEKARWL